MILPDPEFITQAEVELVALSRQFTMDTRTDIPAMWNDFWSRDWNLPGDQEQAAFGVSYDMSANGQFSYAVGLHFSPTPQNIPADACLVTLSAGRYAVFRNQGPVSELPTMFDTIFGSWLPNSGCQQRDGAVFERYPFSDDASPDNMAYEIWVPVSD